jgi:hypothetical protein
VTNDKNLNGDLSHTQLTGRGKRAHAPYRWRHPAGLAGRRASPRRRRWSPAPPPGPSGAVDQLRLAKRRPDTFSGPCSLDGP